MRTFNYVVTDELGIHARPAGLLVKEAKKYESVVKIKKGEKEADMSRLMQIMALGIKKGEEVCVVVEGTDEETAASELEAFFQGNL